MTRHHILIIAGTRPEVIKMAPVIRALERRANRFTPTLVTTGQRTRDEVMAYFLQLFHKLERKPGAQWDGLANACTDLWPQEAIDELDRASVEFGEGAHEE